jgi:hypothetical protein
MKFGEKRSPGVIDATMIAPCGMNCGICSGFLRETREMNVCPGCNGDDACKPVACVTCRIKTCVELERSGEAFCFACTKYPCTRMKQLDKRYRTKYGMSMLENLANIRELRLDEFVARERVRWTCPGCGGVICVHRQECVYCGKPRG